MYISAPFMIQSQQVLSWQEKLKIDNSKANFPQFQKWSYVVL